MSTLKHILVLLFVVVCSSNGAKILGVYPISSYSHFTLGNRLMRELALRGHEVTYISPYADKNPVKGYTDVVLTGFVEKMEENQKEMNMLEMADSSKIMTQIFMTKMCLDMSEDLLSHKNVQALLTSNATFDLIIFEPFLNDAVRGLQYHYKAPCILSVPVGASSFVNHLVANPAPASYIPEMFLAFVTKNMNFWQRVQNVVFTSYSDLILYLYHYPKHNALLHKYFPGAPDIFDLVYDIPLVLLNSHISTSRPVPQVTNMVEIGGFHVYPPKKLPQNLQKFLDEATEGVILFSMGSIVKSKDLHVEKRDALLRTFSKLKMKVLWKWENDTLPGQPKNVKLEKWLPQQDILPHPNIKLFITHGGLLSTTEAIYHGVPVIGIPIFGDQQTNIALAESGGYGLSISYNDLNEEILTKTINEMLNNPKYTQTAKRRQRLLHDRPMTPINTAMWWIEYVLRNPESDFYRSPALDLNWYQFLLLDVLLFLFAAFVITVATIVFLIKIICCRTSKTSELKKILRKKNK